MNKCRLELANTSYCIFVLILRVIIHSVEHICPMACKHTQTHTETQMRAPQIQTGRRHLCKASQPISSSWTTQIVTQCRLPPLTRPRPETVRPLRVPTWPLSIIRDECEKSVSPPARLYASSLENSLRDLVTAENTGNSNSPTSV